jgi:hypothetical protein
VLGVLLAAAITIEIPLLGEPLAPEVVEELSLLPGADRIEAEEGLLRLSVAAGKAVRYFDIARALRDHTVATEIDVDQVQLGRHTIFQMDAGRCFECASSPLEKRLERKAWVERWAVVGYAPKGRMLFRIEPKEPTTLDALGRLPFEDLIFTDQYDAVSEVMLDWSTGGVHWRATEEEAREEAARLKKPLLFFPTAGT